MWEIRKTSIDKRNVFIAIIVKFQESLGGGGE